MTTPKLTKLEKLAVPLSDRLLEEFLSDTLERERDWYTGYNEVDDMDDMVELEKIALTMFVTKLQARLDRDW
jgi:hypothetical protein